MPSGREAEHGSPVALYNGKGGSADPPWMPVVSRISSPGLEQPKKPMVIHVTMAHATNAVTALDMVAQLNADGTMNGNDCGDNSNGGSHQTDWRLPNVRELYSLVDYGVDQPAIPSGHPFDNEQSYDYWSSTYITGNTIGAAWSVSFNQGDVNSTATNNNGYVWPVRGGN